MSGASDVFGRLNAQNKALAALDAASRDRIQPVVEQAFGQVKPYLAVVFGNNPGATPAQVLQRTDVQAAINRALSSVTSQVESQIAHSAASAWSLGVTAASQQLSDLGLDLAGFPNQTSSAYLEAVVSQLQTAVDEFKTDLSDAVKAATAVVPKPSSVAQDPENGVVNVPMAHAVAKGQAASDAIDSILRNLTWRSQLAVSAATQRSYADANAQAYGMSADQHETQMGKMWVANYASGHTPCPACAALSGQVVPWDSEFEHPAKLDYKIFDKLDGPQLHPNCQCKLVPVALSAPEPTPPAPNALAHTPVPAEPAAVEQALVLPASVALSRTVTSKSIREMPASTFVKLLAALLAILVSMLRRRRG